MFKEFVDIWNNDRSKSKVKANRMLAFIFYLCDITEENPLRDVAASEKESEAMFRAFHVRSKKFVKKEEHLLEQGIKLYINLNMTPEERLLHTFDDKAKELSQVLELTVPETVTNVENGVVSFASNSKIITNALSKLSKIRSNREKIVSYIRKETITSRVRGDLALSPLVRGLIQLQ